MSNGKVAFVKTPGYNYFCTTLDAETRRHFPDPRVFWLAMSDEERFRFEVAAYNVHRRIKCV